MKNSKSIIIAFILALAASFSVTSCTKPKGEGDNFNDYGVVSIKGNSSYTPSLPNIPIIEIREKMFATQVSDVYLNAGDYIGKTIKLEGIFKAEKSTIRDEPYCFVVRYGPGGCCGIDANVGFEVVWAKNRAQAYPRAESWVEATGVIKTYEENEFQYLYIDLSSLKVLSKRGMEYVRQ